VAAGKVSGPGSGPPVGGPVDDEGNVDAPGGVGRAFADKLAGADAARPTAGSTAAAAAAAADRPAAATAAHALTADIAAELEAGRIDAKTALDRVIARVVDQQVGPGAPTSVREALRAALESAVADDPLLGEKIKALGG